MRLLFVGFIYLILVNCTGVRLPPGMENQHSFTQYSDKHYVDIYRIISKQMRACYEVRGIFGNGFVVQSDLDSSRAMGIIELYPVGLSGAESASDSIFSKKIIVSKTKDGTKIITMGTTPSYVYSTHKTISNWIKGISTCSPNVVLDDDLP